MPPGRRMFSKRYHIPSHGNKRRERGDACRVTATTFKSRLASHKASFEAEQKRNSTELSKHIWNLKDKNLNYAIKWRILSRASHYSIYNKEMQPMHNRKILYYKRNELINKCRHKEKFLLRHLK